MKSESLQVVLAGLSGHFSGVLLRPSDAGYDDARRIHNGMFVGRPALIARCLGTADLVDAVRFARAHDLELAVRGGGHSVAGKSVCEGGLMLDLSLMKGIHVDPGRRTVRAQGGVLWGEFNRETQLHGLATTEAWSPRPASRVSRSEAGSAGSWASTGSPPTT